MDELRNAKILGGIGALLTLIGVIPTIGWLFGIIGFILVLIAVKYIADAAKEKSIMNNYLYFFILSIISLIIPLIILLYTFQSVGGISYFMEFQNMTDPLAIWEYIQPVLMGAIGAFVALWVILLISAIFLKKSYDKIGDVTKVKWFKTTGFIFLIGAATLIIVIGFFIVLIGIILEIVAFFSLPDELPKAAGGEKKEPDRRCPNCGRAIPMDAKVCPYCAKKFEE